MEHARAWHGEACSVPVPRRGACVPARCERAGGVGSARGGELPSSSRGEERGAALERAEQEARGRGAGRAEQSGPGAGRGGAVGPRGRGGGKERGKEKKKRKKENGREKKKRREREKEERGREIRVGSTARGRPRAAPITRARSGACAAGCVRGSRANRVMDSGVGVGSFGFREIGRKSSELND